MTIFERVKQLNLPLGQYAVYGGALLDVWGIRKANDLDIVVMPKLYSSLKNKGWKEEQYDDFVLLLKDDASVSTVQPPRRGRYNPDRIKLIKEAVIINGVPFVRIEEVIAVKKHHYQPPRPKDLDDLTAIEKYLSSRKSTDIYQFSSN